MNKVVVFDGECILCSNVVNWLLKKDKKNRLLFTTHLSESGKALTKQLGENAFSSVLFYSNSRLYTQSDAVLKIAYELGGVYKLSAVLFIFPVCIRNLVYKIISKNRYKWLGKSESCFVPLPEQRHKFI